MPVLHCGYYVSKWFLGDRRFELFQSYFERVKNWKLTVCLWYNYYRHALQTKNLITIIIFIYGKKMFFKCLFLIPDIVEMFAIFIHPHVSNSHQVSTDDVTVTLSAARKTVRKPRSKHVADTWTRQHFDCSPAHPNLRTCENFFTISFHTFSYLYRWRERWKFTSHL